MAVRLKHALSPAAYADQLAKEKLRELEPEVIATVEGKLFNTNIQLDAVDIEGAYNHAWHGVVQMIASGEPVNNLPGLLVHITYKRAVDAFRQRQPDHLDRYVDDLSGESDTVDLLDVVHAKVKMSGLLERVQKRLNPSEQTIIALCVIHGYSGPQAAEIMGIPYKTFKRTFDDATKRINGIVAGMVSRGCGDEEWSRALRAYAHGVMDQTSPDYQRITDHLQTCAACKRYVNGLQGLAALLPAPLGLPLAPISHPTLLTHLVHAASHATRLVRTPFASTTGVQAPASATGGLTGTLGTGTLIKAAAIIAATAAVGVSIPVLTAHSAAHQRTQSKQTNPTSITSGRLTPASAPRTPARRPHRDQRQRHQTPPSRRPRLEEAVPATTEPHASVPPANAAAQPTSVSPAPHPPHPRCENEGEFSFERQSAQEC